MGHEPWAVDHEPWAVDYGPWAMVEYVVLMAEAVAVKQPRGLSSASDEQVECDSLLRKTWANLKKTRRDLS